MAGYTITLTDIQERALKYIGARLSLEIESTSEEKVQNIIDNYLSQYVEQINKFDDKQVLDILKADPKKTYEEAQTEIKK